MGSNPSSQDVKASPLTNIAADASPECRRHHTNFSNLPTRLGCFHRTFVSGRTTASRGPTAPRPEPVASDAFAVVRHGHGTPSSHDLEPRLDQRMALHMALNEAAQWHKLKVQSPMRGIMVHRLHNEIDMVYDASANFPTHPVAQRLIVGMRGKVAGAFAPRTSAIIETMDHR